MTESEKNFFQEFKAPLIAIIGMTELLKQSQQTDEQRAYTRNIEESAHALLNLVKTAIESQEFQQAHLLETENMRSVVNELRELVNGQSLTGVMNPAVDASTIRVLVVEDNPMLQLIILKQLAHLGIRAEAVGDGQSAIKVAPGFDLIFMDCRLPAMDGFDATKAIRAAEAEVQDGKTKRIVALTAGYEDEIKEKCLQSGMDDCLIKPVGSQALKSVIERWFRLGAAS